MVLNWGKINKTPTQQTTSNKTSLDWSKVTKTTQPLPYTDTTGKLNPVALTQGVQNIAQKAKQEQTQNKINEITGGQPTAFVPRTLNVGELETAEQEFKENQRKQELAKDFLPQAGRNLSASVASGLANVHDATSSIVNKFTSQNKLFTAATQDLLDPSKNRYSEALKDVQHDEKEDRERMQWARDYNKYIQEGNQNYDGLAKGTLNAINVGGNMLASSPAGVPGLFLNSMGGAYNQALDEGATEQEAYRYGLASGALETAVETLSGGAAQKLTNVPALAKISKFADNIDNKLLRFGANVAGDVVGEGTEEMITALADPYIQKITYNPDAGFQSVSEALSSMGGAFKESVLPTLLMGGTSTTINGVNSLLNKQISAINSSNLSQNEKRALINQVQQEANQIIENAEKNVASESSQIEQTQPTNEVIPQMAQNQNTANMVQNNANMQNDVQNQSNIEQISQNNVENAPNLPKTVQKIKRKTQSWNIPFEEQVDKYINGKLKTGDLLYLGETPSILTQIGHNNNPITLKQSKLKTMITPSNDPNSHNHGMSVDIVKQLPRAINNPLNILKSSSDPNSVVMITDLADDLDRPIIVSIQIDSDGQVGDIKFFSNEMTSAYGKRNYEEFMDREIAKGNLLYDIDEGIIKEPPATGLQLSKGIGSSDVSSTTNIPINNIIQPTENYVNNQENFALPTAEQLNQPSQEMIEAAQALTLEEKQSKPKTGFMLANEGDSYKRNMFNNNAKAINDLIKAKRIVSDEFDVKIREKQQMLNSKKDKTTKVAQNLQTQIINLQKRKANAEQKFIKQIDRLENRNATINKLKKQVSEDRLPTRKEVKQDIITQTDMENINLDDTKDLSKFIMNNTTPLRVNEKIFDRETAAKINDTFFKPIKHNEAERIRFLNKERNEIKALGIEPNTRESEYVQIYGEGEWVNPSTGESSEYTLDDLKKQFPEDWEKIKTAAEKIREKYDTYLDAVNKELNKMGYDSIPKLKNYFRHFEATTSLLDQIGIPSKADHLPTDMNGLTSDLRPGKNFFANALSRTGKKTTYDAITGIDGYLEGVSKLMYHTEDIQKLRTFDEYIRNKYGQATELEGLSKKEFQERVEQIQEGHLSEYAAWLSEYTNNLAGKKSKMDRGAEEALGRRIYGTLNAVKKQVGSNLTGFNLNSALSNFISITQAGSKTSKYAMLEGLGDTVKNIFQDDGFINKSDFLTRRFGSDKLYKTSWEKASNAGQLFMAGTDYFSANLITRSKYYEYLNKGYPDAEAMKLADEFADRIMGGRALGDMPNIFNSKTLGILTQFQLENVNQFDTMFHDTKYENRAEEQTKYEANTWNEKLKSKLANEKPEFYNSLSATLILGQLFAYAWAYNKVDEELTGSGGAFDPIGIVEDLIKDFTNPNLTKGEAIKNLALNIVDVIPYANTITGGGRVPMTDALPNIVDILEGEAGWDEMLKVLNLGLPTGGGQLLKTAKGAIALAQGGDYKTNAKGEKQLKFPIAQEGNIAQRIGEGAQALLFGKWATPGGQKYIEDGFKPLSAVQTEGLERAQNMGIAIKEFYDIMNAIEEIEVPKRKNSKGKEESIPGARKQLIKDELNSRKELTDEQRKLLYDIFYNKELN